ncbi:MAG: TlpA disulfide reductase family protein [Candidatus Hydrogenedentes bacterium]|nr:TlpA disulfide reductase family protein [Candidatus Hydrogenedentota bacterium]
MATVIPPPIAPQPLPSRPPPGAGSGLGAWSIGAGILGLAGSTCLLGLILGPLGIVLALIAMGKPDESRWRIAFGLALSGAALLASVAAAVVTFNSIGTLGPQSWEGVRAPDFTLRTSNGETVRLSALRGKMVFVDVWATWCPPCIESIPHLELLAEKYKAGGVVVLGLSTDAADTLREYLDDKPIGYATGVIGHGFPEPYGTVAVLPTLFVIDRNGVIVAVERGYHSYEEISMLARLPDYPGTPLDPPNRKSPEVSDASDGATRDP